MSHEELKNALASDPGDSRFPEYASALLAEGKLDEALDCLMSGLTKNPSNHRGRVLLARVYYEKGYLPFAVRELEVLQMELPDNKYLRRLMERIAPDRVLKTMDGRQTEAKEETIAETEFDIGEIELIESKE